MILKGDCLSKKNDFLRPKRLVCTFSCIWTLKTPDGEIICSTYPIEPRIETKSEMLVINILPINSEDKRFWIDSDNVLKLKNAGIATAPKNTIKDRTC